MKYTKTLKNLFLSAIFLMLITLSYTASADGMIIIEPPILPPPTPQVDLAVKYHHVDVSIENQVATVNIDQVFVNKNPYDVEGTYMFPIPKDAALKDFSMFVEGEKLEGEILDKDEAQRIYEETVRKMIDPALLEYAGTGMYKARIYPIEANSEKRVEISYTQIINKNNNNLHFLYPLNTEKFSSEKLENVTITVSVEHSRKLKNIYSPTHNIAITRPSDYSAKISYEENDVKPEMDFELFMSEDENDVGISVISYKEKDEDGYFMLLASPKVEVSNIERLPKDIVFVIDTSGSMSGEKIKQAKDALIFNLNTLQSENDGVEKDRYNIVYFSDTVNKYKDGLQVPNHTSVQEAKDFVAGIEAAGGTNINDSLLQALDMFQDEKRSNIIVFLTDGEATVGEMENGAIIKNAKDANQKKVKVFVFGVGYDVNTHLLDFLANDSKALSTYVDENENIERKVSSLYEKISHPMLTDLSVSFTNDIGEYDLFPVIIPDIYKGSQLVMLGRYKNAASSLLSLQGKFQDVSRGYTSRIAFPEENTKYDYIPSLWAARKIGYLLDQIRLHGDDSKELKQSIIELSKKYGIITEYTSFLIDLDTPVNEPGFFDEAEEAFDSNLMDQGFEMQTGGAAQKAVQNTQTLQRSLNISDNQSLWGEDVQQSIKQVDNKVFYYQNNSWVDNDYVDQTLTQVAYGSDEYFDLLAVSAMNGKYMAIDKNVTFCMDGNCYQVIAEEAPDTPDVTDPQNIPDIPEIPPEDTILFDDLSKDHWAVSFIEEMVNKKFIQGYSDNTFKPDNSITRAEFLKIILLAFDITQVDSSAGEISFPDVEDSDWFSNVVYIAASNGIVGGYEDGSFKPNNPITRAEAVKILLKIMMIDEQSIEDADFTDISDHWAKDFITTATELMLVSGYSDGTFKPNNPITRAEAVKVIMKGVEEIQ